MPALSFGEAVSGIEQHAQRCQLPRMASPFADAARMDGFADLRAAQGGDAAAVAGVVKALRLEWQAAEFQNAAATRFRVDDHVGVRHVEYEAWMHAMPVRQHLAIQPMMVR